MSVMHEKSEENSHMLYIIFLKNLFIKCGNPPKYILR